MARSSIGWNTSATRSTAPDPAKGSSGLGMRKLLTVISVILLIAGLVFVAQGSGYFPHPAESFMINQIRWVYYGAAIAVAGLLLGVVTRRY
jgi:hypothetical protein